MLARLLHRASTTAHRGTARRSGVAALSLRAARSVSSLAVRSSSLVPSTLQRHDLERSTRTKIRSRASGGPVSLFSSTTKASNATDSPHVIEVTKENFQSVMQGSETMPTILDCYADWCGPCKTLTPILEKAVEEANGKVLLAKINTDEQPDLAKALKITSLPTVYGIYQGKAVDQFMGMQPPEKLKSFMEEMTSLADNAAGGGGAEGGGGGGGDGGSGGGGGGGPMTAEEDIAHASSILHDQQDPLAAAAIYQAVLQRDDVEETSLNAAIAMCGLLSSAIKSGDKTAISGLIEHITDAKSPHAEHVENKETHLYTIIGEGKLLLSLEDKLGADGSNGTIEDLQVQIVKEPKNIEAWYSLSVQLLSRGEHSESIDAALRVVRLDKTWNDGAGKQLLFEIFEMLGSDSALVKDARRRLSSYVM